MSDPQVSAEDKAWVEQGEALPSLRLDYNQGDFIYIPAGTWCSKNTKDGDMWKNDRWVSKEDMNVEIVRLMDGSRRISRGHRLTSLPQIKFQDEDGWYCSVDIDDKVFIANEDIRIAKQYPSNISTAHSL